MNKKGFTLIELMGVVVILSILVMIAVPVVDKYIKQTKLESAKVQKETLILAAKNWAGDNKDSLPLNSGNSIHVSLDTLMEMGYLDLDIVSNISKFEVDGQNLSVYDSVKITNDGKKYVYELKIDESTDNTAPVNLTMKYITSTINSLTVKAFAEDPESAIVKYEFNIDGERNSEGGLKWQGATAAKVHTFEDISEGEHIVMFRATNAKGLSTESKKFTYNTRSLTRMEFIVKDEPNDCCSPRTIRIIYPANSVSRTYQIFTSNPIQVTTAYKDVTVNGNGDPIIAEALVENIRISATYNVKFKKMIKSGNKEVEYYCTLDDTNAC